MSKTSIAQSAAILTFAGVLTRVMGFAYRIYLVGRIGARGMGLYQLIMPLYALAWSVSCAGFTTTISKLAAEEEARGDGAEGRKLLKACLMFSVSLGFILSVLLYFGADFAAARIFGDGRAAMGVRTLSFAFPAMAAGSCLRGYFFGMRESLIPAVNQVLEQIVRMAAVFLIFYIKPPADLEEMCAACVLGVVAEEIFSFIYIAVCYKTKYGGAQKKRGRRSAARRVLKSSVPLGLNRVAGSLLAAAENVLIPARLALFAGSADAAMEQFGIITGMATPLIFFPSAFLVSLSVSLVPAISEAASLGQKPRIKRTVEKTLLLSVLLGVGAAAGFIVFAKELGEVVYKQDVGGILALLGAMCPLIYLQMTLQGVLNGMGEQAFILRNNLLSSAITIGCIWFLLPVKGTAGFVAGWLLALFAATALSMDRLCRTVDISADLVNWAAKPALAAAAPALFLKLVKGRIFGLLPPPLALLVCLTLLAVCYGWLLIVLGCITKKDIDMVFKVRYNKKSAAYSASGLNR